MPPPVGLPVPADFAPPPDAATRARWRDAEHAQLPGRLERLRERMATEGVGAYFGVKREHMRWLTGFTLADGEEKVAGHSGQLLVGPEDVVLVTDSRYTIQARREAPDAVVDEIGYDLAASWPRLVERAGARRVAVEAGAVSHAL